MNALMQQLLDAKKKIEELEAQLDKKHKIEIGGPACPTCGFIITKEKATPLVYREDDE